ncbi:MAG: hypothetical protein AB7G93_13240 [Bdellovibrionales bacterium]
MKYFILVVVLFSFSMGSLVSRAEGKHEAKEHEENEDHEHKDGEHNGHDEEHKGEEGHGEHGEEEENASVGPEKGIIEANEEKGFKLSPEALKNFEIKTLKLANSPPWNVPSTAKVRSGNEINLFRLRDGYFKRIDFNEVRKQGSQIFVASPDLKKGDEIVTIGLGFLRIAELSAFGGLAEGHSH